MMKTLISFIIIFIFLHAFTVSSLLSIPNVQLPQVPIIEMPQLPNTRAPQNQVPQKQAPQKQVPQKQSPNKKVPREQPKKNKTPQKQPPQNQKLQKKARKKQREQAQRKKRREQAPKKQVPQKQVPNVPVNPLHDMYKAFAGAKPHAYLNAHNAFRQKMGVPPLQWDTKLEAYARNYVAIRANDCLLKHSYGPYGENIFWEQYGLSSPAQVVKRFTDEQVNYDLQKSVCKCQPISSKCMCGHFTQVIWKTTNRVACAEAICSAEKGKLIVCSYDPPGNAPGKNPLKPLM